MAREKDQADTLRRLMRQREESKIPEEEPSGRSVIVTFSSGKGGVGKSSLVANLGAILARSGVRVLLVDGDLGLANLDILLGVKPQATVEQILNGSATVNDAVIGIEPNLWLLPAASGLFEACSWEPSLRAQLARTLESCPWDMDLILVDLGAGIHENVISVHHPAYQSVVILTPEPTSMTDAYGLVKVLRRDRSVNQVNIIVNQVTDGREGLAVFQRFREVANRFLDVQLDYLGHCIRDEKFLQAVMKRKILLDLEKEALAVPAMELLAKRMRSGFSIASGSLGYSVSSRFMEEPARIAPGMKARFWRTLLGEVKA